jgi:hypothetical protein
VRRLVPLPIDQIRPGTVRFWQQFPWRLLLLCMYFSATFLGAILIPIAMMDSRQWWHSRGHYVHVPIGEVCNAAIPLVEVHSPIPPTSLKGDALWLWNRDAKPQFRFNGERVGPEGLLPHIEPAIVRAPWELVYVRGERNADVRHVYAAIDELQGFDPQLTIILVTPTMERTCPRLRGINEKAPPK